MVEPYRASKKRKAIQTAKFYFFDTGVTHAILNLKILDRASSNYGTALEQWIFMELQAYLSLNRKDEPLRFWRTLNGQEVDFIIGDETAIEVKATKRVTNKDLSGLAALAEEKKFKKFYIISHEPSQHTMNGVQCLSFHDFLAELWAGKII